MMFPIHTGLLLLILMHTKLLASNTTDPSTSTTIKTNGMVIISKNGKTEPINQRTSISPTTTKPKDIATVTIYPKNDTSSEPTAKDSASLMYVVIVIEVVGVVLTFIITMCVPKILEKTKFYETGPSIEQLENRKEYQKQETAFMTKPKQKKVLTTIKAEKGDKEAHDEDESIRTERGEIKTKRSDKLKEQAFD